MLQVFFNVFSHLTFLREHCIILFIFVLVSAKLIATKRTTQQRENKMDFEKTQKLIYTINRLEDWVQLRTGEYSSDDTNYDRVEEYQTWINEAKQTILDLFSE